jgi:SPP1 family holin
MKISKGTIIRTILMILVIVNIILERNGIDVIPADESTITMLVETLIEIAVLGVSFWKNNSFSENAIKADAFLKKLKEDEIECEVDEW